MWKIALIKKELTIYACNSFSHKNILKDKKKVMYNIFLKYNYLGFIKLLKTFNNNL